MRILLLVLLFLSFIQVAFNALKYYGTVSDPSAYRTIQIKLKTGLVIFVLILINVIVAFLYS